MKDMLKTIGVLATTGAMAVIGLISGVSIFKPESITINRIEKEKESK